MLNQPEHFTGTRTQPRVPYIITDNGFLDNPYCLQGEPLKHRIWEGLKHIYHCQGHVSLNNYRALCKGKNRGNTFASSLMDEHLSARMIGAK